MSSESHQQKLSRVRSPRVHLTYDVQIGDAIQQKELPFVLGVLADLSGHPDEALPPLKNRNFVKIDRDDFNKVMGAIKPRLAFQVENTLQGDNTKMNVELRFNKLEDFEPEHVVKQVEPLKKLLEARDRLSGLLTKMDGNDKLESLLQDVIQSTDALKTLSTETGREAGKSEAGKSEEAPQ